MSIYEIRHVYLFCCLLLAFIMKGLYVRSTAKVIYGREKLRKKEKPGRCIPWSQWWTYDGISGPDFWGKIYKDFTLCSKGKNQSPINIVPEDLLFDPGLKHIHIAGNKISVTMINHGNSMVLYLNDTLGDDVEFSIGPLSYTYKLHQIRVHFGMRDNMGSEHMIDGKQFSAELHLLAYNMDLYKNYSQAERSPRGIAGIALFVQAKGNASNPELEKIVHNIKDVQYKGGKSVVDGIYIQSLIPNSHHYVTYDGSLTHPGCYETVTWIIMNRPIYAGAQQVEALRTLRKSGRSNPQAFMFNTVRPVMSLERRSVRTNINFANAQSCSMERKMHYEVTFPWIWGVTKDLSKDSSDRWSDVTTLK